MPGNERRFWPRQEVHAHVLGEVKRVMVGSYQVRVLMLYETAVERDALPDAMPVTRGKLFGDMDDIYCTICGRTVANWRVGEDALEALLSRVIST
jgi:hypothetical protein